MFYLRVEEFPGNKIISVGPYIYENLTCGFIEPVELIGRQSVCVPSLILSVLGGLCYCI